MSKGKRLRQPERKARRELRRTPPAYFDLVQWLRDRNYASTNKQARDLILAGRVTADSHKLGVGKDVVFEQGVGFKEVEVVKPHVPVGFKSRVIVSEAT